MKRQVAKGTAKYIIGEVKRFDQKNEGFNRGLWDPALKPLAEKFYGLVYPKDKDGYSLKDLSFRDAAWHVELEFGHGTVNHNWGMYSWESKLIGLSELPPGLKLEVNDPVRMSQELKKVAKFLGASLVGISELDRRWVYSHSYDFETGEHRELELPEEYKYAVVLAFEMDYELVKTSPTWLAEATEGKGYSMMAFTTSMVARFIRGLGYKAIPCGNDTALSIPLAIDAGLGELGRNGLLITPEFGPRARLSKVFTDLPLVPDEPIEFGVVEFCEKCETCAKYCPSQAIIYGKRTTQPHNISNNMAGQLKWPVNVDRCFGFWIRNEGSCMNCIRVCPFNKSSGWLHEAVRWLVKKAPWLDPFLVRMDELLGYGRKVRASNFWERPTNDP